MHGIWFYSFDHPKLIYRPFFSLPYKIHFYFSFPRGSVNGIFEDSISRCENRESPFIAETETNGLIKTSFSDFFNLLPIIINEYSIYAAYTPQKYRWWNNIWRFYNTIHLLSMQTTIKLDHVMDCCIWQFTKNLFDSSWTQRFGQSPSVLVTLHNTHTHICTYVCMYYVLWVCVIVVVMGIRDSP